MPKSETIFLAVSVLLTVGLTISGYALNYPPEAMVFPLIVTLCLIAFVGMRVFETRRAVSFEAAGGAGKVDESDTEEAAGFQTIWRPFLWVVGVLVILPVFGFLIGLPLYVLGFLLMRRVSPVTAVSLSVGTGVFIYVVFVRLLQVLLPTGLIGSFLP